MRDTRQFPQISMRLASQCPRFDGPRSQFVQFQAQAIAIRARTLLDHLKLPHRVQQPINGCLIQTQRRRQLRDSHLRAVLAHVE